MQEKLTPASGPRIEPISLEQGGDLKYRAVFEVLPQIQLARRRVAADRAADGEVAARPTSTR